MRRRRPWTEEELAVLREHYPIGGPCAVQRALDAAGMPARSRRVIAVKAAALCLINPRGRSGECGLSSARVRLEDQNVETLRHIQYGLKLAIRHAADDLRTLCKRHQRVKALLKAKAGRSEATESHGKVQE